MANRIVVENKNPYVGPRPFQKGETLYGRDRETFELTNLLIAERIVLLYSPAGAGKSSLLAAAMPPALQKEGFGVLGPVRPGQEPPMTLEKKPGFNRYAYCVMLSLEENLPKSQRFSSRKLAALRLADYFTEYRARAKQIDPKFDERQPLALIVDQAEEVITKNPADREVKAEFFAQLGEALRDRSLYTLFSIREDFLASLDPYLAPVPTRMAARYRLNMLDTGEAMQAVQQPAKQVGMGFADDAAKKLVDDLRRIRVQQADGTMEETLGPYVEPVQLQVVCRRLWTKVIPSDLAAAVDDEDLEGYDYAVGGITEDDIASLGDIDNALADYYAMQVGDVAKAARTNERAIREWFDKKLISPQGVRGQVLLAPETSEGLKNKTIWLLEQTYLIRAEKRGGATWFELAHDRLIKPVRENNTVWFEENLSMVQRQAEVWNAQGRADGLLINGKDFLEARKWASTHSRKMTPVEKEFLAACQKGYDQAVRDRRMNIAIRWLGGVAVLLSIVAVIFAIQAINQTHQANARAWAANANSDLADNPPLSIFEALKAISSTKNPLSVAEDSLRRAVPELRTEWLTVPDLQSPGGVFVVAYSPDRKTFATSGEDGSVRLWDVATAQAIVHPFDVHRIRALAFNPDGSLLAVGGDDGLLEIHRVDTWETVRSLTGGDTWALAFNPDGSRLASADGNGVATVWDVGTGEKQLTLNGHTNLIEAIKFSPDGKLIATAGDDDTARLWDAETGSQLFLLNRHTGFVYSVAFSPDGRLLATSSADRSIKTWDVETGAEIMTIPGHLDWVYTVAFSNDGTRLISSSADGTIRVWDTTYGRQISSFGSYCTYSMALDADSRRAAAVDKYGNVCLLDISPAGSFEKLTLDNKGKRVYGAAYSPDGTRIATGSADKLVKVWDANSGKLLLQMLGHTDAVEDVTFSPDGTRIASASRDGTVRVWDASTGQQVWMADLQKGRLWSVVFSPDGTRVAVSGNAGLVRVLDSRNGAALLSIGSESDGTVQTLAYSPDGKALATTYNGASYGANIWDASTGKLLIEVRGNAALGPGFGHTEMVEAVAFSPDGKILATGSDDFTVILWDISSGTQAVQTTLYGTGGVVYALAFSPDGKSLAAGSSDTRASIIYLGNEGIRITLYGHTDRIYSVHFSPDGKNLLTAGADATVHIHYVQLSDLIQSATGRAIRAAYPGICEQFLNDCPAP